MTDPWYLTSELCAWAAMLLPGALLVLRWRSPRRMPWWLFAVSVVFGVWGLVCLADDIYYRHAMQLVTAYKGGTPPRAMIENATSDAGRGINKIFGFAYGPVFSLPWLLIYAGASLIVGKLGKRKRNQAAGQITAATRGEDTPPTTQT